MTHTLRVEDPRHEPLLRRLYDTASIDLKAGEEEYVTRSGRRLSWALDLRRPLLRSELLQPTAAALADRLEAAGGSQIAGSGMGAAPLVCGMVALGRGIDGLLLREVPKQRGFLRPYEGEADPGRPVWVIDDLVNTGSSVGSVAKLLREQGLEVVGVLCLFHYTWGGARKRLGSLGLRLEPLAELRKIHGLHLARNPLLSETES